MRGCTAWSRGRELVLAFSAPESTSCRRPIPENAAHWRRGLEASRRPSPGGRYDAHRDRRNGRGRRGRLDRPALERHAVAVAVGTSTVAGDPVAAWMNGGNGVVGARTHRGEAALLDTGAVSGAVASTLVEAPERRHGRSGVLYRGRRDRRRDLDGRGQRHRRRHNRGRHGWNCSGGGRRGRRRTEDALGHRIFRHGWRREAVRESARSRTRRMDGGCEEGRRRARRCGDFQDHHDGGRHQSDAREVDGRGSDPVPTTLRTSHAAPLGMEVLDQRATPASGQTRHSPRSSSRDPSYVMHPRTQPPTCQ